MGKVVSMMSNPLRNFNLESRAHKVISQSKPIPAPKYKKDELDFERLMKDYPDVYQQSLKKNKKLDGYLKEVYVTSHDPKVEVRSKSNPDRPLPIDRHIVQSFMHGVKEPNHIPMGKVALGSVLEFISRHQGEPMTYNAKKIAEEYMLPEETVKSVLKFYRVFEIYIPQERETKAKFAGPSVPKVHVIKELRKELPSGSPSKDKT